MSRSPEPAGPVTIALAGPAGRAQAWRATLEGAERERLQVLPTATGKVELMARLAFNPEALLIDAALFSGPGELIGVLSQVTAITYVVLPAAASEADCRAVAALPCVRAVYPGDVDALKLARRAYSEAMARRKEQGQVATRSEPAEADRSPATPAPATGAGAVEPLPAPPPSTGAIRIRVRLGFYGARGGVGVSTAALRAAQVLAAEGQRVALFDATGRGDLHLMLGAQPPEPALRSPRPKGVGSGAEGSKDAQPVVLGAITLFLGAPTEEAAAGFDLVIVDGGRTRGKFNAEWIEVSDPLPDGEILWLTGLGPVEDKSRPPFSLWNLLSRTSKGVSG